MGRRNETGADWESEKPSKQTTREQTEVAPRCGVVPCAFLRRFWLPLAVRPSHSSRLRTLASCRGSCAAANTMTRLQSRWTPALVADTSGAVPLVGAWCRWRCCPGRCSSRPPHGLLLLSFLVSVPWSLPITRCVRALGYANAKAAPFPLSSLTQANGSRRTARS